VILVLGCPGIGRKAEDRRVKKSRMNLTAEEREKVLVVISKGQSVPRNPL
jgi:hypothetical protein